MGAYNWTLLWQGWELGLLKLEPLTGLAYVSVGALSLVLLTPVGWIASALF